MGVVLAPLLTNSTKPSRSEDEVRHWI